MRKEARLTKPRQYALVYRQGISRASPLLVLRAIPNNLPSSRFGFSVSKRVGGAVVRNRMKRLLREICPLMKIVVPSDIVFIVRPPAAGATYDVLKQGAESLLGRAGLLQGAFARNAAVQRGPDRQPSGTGG